MTKGMPLSLLRRALYARAAMLPAIMAGLSLFWIGLALAIARLS